MFLRIIINNCEKYGIVFEDDVKVKTTLIKKVNKLLKAIDDHNVDLSIMWLWNGNWMQTSRYQHKAFTTDRLEVKRETIPYNAGAVGYIISASFARYLVENAFPIRWPWDLTIGDQVYVGEHLTLRMKYDRKTSCYISPLFDMDCGGEHGTGASTQDYRAKTVKKIAKHC